MTQGIAADLHADAAVTGLRWWAAFFGEWHTAAFFSDRLADGDLRFGDPETLHLDPPAVAAAAAALGMEVQTRQ